MNRKLCKHEWKDMDKPAKGINLWCFNCGCRKFDDCGNMRYRYPRVVKYTIWEASRKNGTKARRHKIKETK